MTKVGREVVASGQWILVEYALDAEGATMPAREFVKDLEAGIWDEDPYREGEWDEREPKLAARLLALIESVADGHIPPPGNFGCLNFLNEGLWEFKVSQVRLTFYDTDGRGGCPTHGFEATRWDQREKLPPESFGELGPVRTGHPFAKRDDQQKTPPEHLREAFQAREDDLVHDREV